MEKLMVPDFPYQLKVKYKEGNNIKIGLYNLFGVFKDNLERVESHKQMFLKNPEVEDVKVIEMLETSEGES